MPGKGPRPKDAGRLAGHGAGKARADGMRVYEATLVEQPGLPDFDVQIEVDGEIVSQSFVWPPATRRWWMTWGDEPMSCDFTATDWDFLLDTALLHAKVWGYGDLKFLPELRLRVAKMGATSEDRARLRITYAAADEADQKRAAKQGDSSRARRGPLKAV